MGYGDAWSYVARARMNKMAADKGGDPLSKMTKEDWEALNTQNEQDQANLDEAVAALKQEQAGRIEKFKKGPGLLQRVKESTSSGWKGGEGPIGKILGALKGAYGGAKGYAKDVKELSDLDKVLEAYGEKRLTRPWWKTDTAQWLGIGTGIAALGGGAYGVHKIRQAVKRRRKEREELARRILEENGQL